MLHFGKENLAFTTKGVTITLNDGIYVSKYYHNFLNLKLKIQFHPKSIGTHAYIATTKYLIMVFLTTYIFSLMYKMSQ